ncbi:MAG TPA: hypothetical protein VFH27_02815 [Longimicrobiaceae bacterium]|nr:hypothetical protein [Longimicrobiaceae bacterium]
MTMTPRFQAHFGYEEGDEGLTPTWRAKREADQYVYGEEGGFCVEAMISASICGVIGFGRPLRCASCRPSKRSSACRFRQRLILLAGKGRRAEIVV